MRGEIDHLSGDVAEEARRQLSWNFFIIVASRVLTRLGDELANAKTVLAWMLGYVGAPLFLVGFLVPIRESGSMLPQLFIAAAVRRAPVRKWIWVLGSVMQAFAVGAMGLGRVKMSTRPDGRVELQARVYGALRAPFDFQRFLQSQYLLAPARGSEQTGHVVVINADLLGGSG